MHSIFRITNGWPLKKKTKGFFFFFFFLELCIQLKLRICLILFSKEKKVCWHDGTNIVMRSAVR